MATFLGSCPENILVDFHNKKQKIIFLKTIIYVGKIAFNAF
ncbi:hypothetical protein THOM_0697 [Trachipleistophora hominis]|uniref:Uncharacterized protein n=1 Tax=Trachipleistophora hominis TaxID=72359 RepID=L7JZ48_TRAHO|nr:hypothetical protein THOM_0697 [Trachipleistophora hominis]